MPEVGTGGESLSETKVRCGLGDGDRCKAGLRVTRPVPHGVLACGTDWGAALQTRLLKPALRRLSPWESRVCTAPQCFGLFTTQAGPPAICTWTPPGPKGATSVSPESLSRDQPFLSSAGFSTPRAWSGVFSADAAGVSLQAAPVVSRLHNLSESGSISGCCRLCPEGLNKAGLNLSCMFESPRNVFKC